MSQAEQLMGALFLLFGVLITPYIIDNFTAMVLQIDKLHGNFEENGKLSFFFSTLESFNEGCPLKKDLIQQMETYFEHRWSHNRNQIVGSQMDLNLMI